MTYVIIFTAGAVLLSGLSIVTGAEFEQQVKASRRWLARKVSFPARAVGASARRMPPRAESAAAAGGAPGAASARLSAAPGAALAALAGPPQVRACCLTTAGERHTRECDEEVLASRAGRVNVYDLFAAALEGDGIDVSGPAPVQRRAPRHAPTEPRIGRIDLSRPGVREWTPDRPPWEIETGTQPALTDAALAAMASPVTRTPEMTR